jgi:hypothetical protein
MANHTTRTDYNSPPDSLEVVKKAAEQGDAGAQYNLGLMFAKGKGVPQDYKEAVKWFTKAAEQGLADAQVNLGVMFDKGEGVPEDYVQAYKWFILAAAQGDKDAAEVRDLLKEKMSREQIAEAQKLARQFKPVISAQPKDTVLPIQQRYNQDRSAAAPR